MNRMKQMQTIATALQKVKHPEKQECLMLVATRDSNLLQKVGQPITSVSITNNWTKMEVQFASGNVTVSI